MVMAQPKEEQMKPNRQGFDQSIKNLPILT